MLERFLLSPPAVFIILLAVITVLSLLARSLQTKANPDSAPGRGEPYASGEDVPTGRIQPGYDFFHIAFVFTIFEVVALMVGTATDSSIWLVSTIFSVVALAILIMFRKD